MFSSFPPPTKYWIIGQGGVITCIVAHNCFTVCFFKLASFELHLVFLTGRGENKNKKNFHICFLYGSTFCKYK